MVHPRSASSQVILESRNSHIPFELGSVPDHGKNMMQRLASGFYRVSNFVASPISMEVVRAIQNLTTAIDAAEKTETVATYLPELVVMRNSIQTRLLCMPAAPNPVLRAGRPSPTDDVYILRAVRLSLLIFSSFVVFPQPHSDASQALRLNAKLLEASDSCISSFGNNGARSLGTAKSIKTNITHLIAWASMLGALNCSADG